jgi:Uma2 family endonuclease
MTTDLRPRLKMTYEDLLYLPEDGKRHEIIDGEHYVSASPAPKHQIAVANLHLALGAHVKEHGLGLVMVAPLDVVLSDIDVVEPDLFFLSHESLRHLGEKFIGGPPDLAVEVLSESTRRVDEVTKRHLYERYGVGEYWIVDPLLESAKLYRLGDDGRYARAAEPAVENGGAFESPLFPGFSLPVARLFD